MKKILFLALFAVTTGNLMASQTGNYLLIETDWGQILFEVIKDVYFTVLFVGLIYATFKIIGEILFFDVRGVRLLSLEESRELEERYRKELKETRKEETSSEESETTNLTTASEKEFCPDFNC